MLRVCASVTKAESVEKRDGEKMDGDGVGSGSGEVVGREVEEAER